MRLSKVHSSEQVTPPAVDEHILFIHSVLAHPGALEVGGHERRCSKILSTGGIPKKAKTMTFAITCKICFALRVAKNVYELRTSSSNFALKISLFRVLRTFFIFK